MLGVFRRCMGALFVAVFAGAAFAQTATFSVEAAARNGVPITPRLSTISAAPGDILTVEILARDWSVNGGQRLRGYQATLDSEAYTGGLRGQISPRAFETTTDLNGLCSRGSEERGIANSDNAFIDALRSDFVHFGRNPTAFTNSIACDYAYGSGVSGGGPLGARGIKRYCGTVILEVSGDAEGMFTLRLAEGEHESFMRWDTGKAITPLAFETLTVTVVPSLAPQPVSAFPPDGAIDARQPSTPAGANRAGWVEIEIAFDRPPVDLTPLDFSVSVLPNNVPPPTIDAVVINGNSARLQFSPPISVGHWTIFSVNGTDFTTRLGFLPGDVNADGTTGPLDIVRLPDVLNGVGDPLPIWQTDIDRSGQTNSSDILREIDLLNGAGVYAAWNGRTLPAN